MLEITNQPTMLIATIGIVYSVTLFLQFIILISLSSDLSTYKKELDKLITFLSETKTLPFCEPHFKSKKIKHICGMFSSLIGNHIQQKKMLIDVMVERTKFKDEFQKSVKREERLKIANDQLLKVNKKQSEDLKKYLKNNLKSMPMGKE
ncbi:MAG: hypothetical protein PHR38_10035 [Bacteroidales bacterium]|jgi:hypothetical protein|nr:hypothetical protein [Bacteroidales bacterium]MDD3331485.1 hypothetical protein [Bacteroidales bacterium]